MRRHNILTALSLAAALLLAAPLRSDGGAPCNDATTSLSSTLTSPVAGDEKFFTLPVGPSNVMFMLDVSGSMANVPQCGDATTWGDSSALAGCKWPTNYPGVSNPAVGAISENGTCTVTPSTNPLNWMGGYDPTANTLVDAGRGTATNGLVDAPPWGTGCTGSNCLFNPTSVYAYQGWSETSATTSSPCAVSFTYQNFNCTTKNTDTITYNGTLATCSSCLTNVLGKGFYFANGYRVAYNTNNTTGTGVNKHCTGTTTTNYYNGGTQQVYLTGGWLNANPPKFMSARKVIKNTIFIDPALPANTDQLRFGLSYMSTAITNGAAIIVPLGPSPANSYPVNPTAFVAARQLILDALNHTHGGLSGWPSGVSLPSLANGGTPMATGLFHVGQYFIQPGTYNTAFGTGYELTAFAPTSKGMMNASWVDSSTTSICWSCQKSAIIIVTDGSPNSEMTFPTALKSYDQNVYTNAQNCGPGTSCSSSPSKCCSPSDNTSSPPSLVPRVAAWLNEQDVNQYFTGKQSVTTSAVSFNLPANNAQTILNASGNMGGGSYNNAADGAALAAAVSNAVVQVAPTATSFSSPAATALTTVNAVDTKAFVTRFKPSQRPTWEGHVFEWMLFDEAAAGCDPTKKPDPNDPTQQVECRGKTVLSNFDGSTTADGYNICTKSFLVDADCDEVVEDSTTGNWYKKGTGSPGTPANKLWDAGEVLSTTGKTGYRTAAEHADTSNIAPYTQYAPGQTPRNIWTALPDGTMLELETKNAAALAPYMNLDQTFCTNIESKLCGSTAPLPSCPVTDTSGNWQKYCAQQVILFARGWDVMDEDGDSCGGPGFGTSYASYKDAGGTVEAQPNPANAANNIGWDGTLYDGHTANTTTSSCTLRTVGSVKYTGEERNRLNDKGAAGPTLVPSFYKLGDIFHSSPVLVHPPTSEAMCKLGLDNQCVRTLFGYTSNTNYAVDYQTQIDSYAACKSGQPNVDAYRAWRNSYAGRENVVLVGSNDGFLHAFDAGGQDASTGSQDIDCAWPNVTDGTGEEIWAFVPPDLLPRLRDTMQNHQYMVDGNVMVRDIWVDGANGGSSDGKKQKTEFRTMAIFGERSGGTQFTALDVTDAFSTDPSTRPQPAFKWSFPPPLSDDAQYMGESWSDFSPRPPPIGPVRLVTGQGEADPAFPDGAQRGWIEKWVVMLNGGYDPTMTRGRAVWTVDAWSGAVLWRYTDTDFKTNVLGGSGATNAGMFPVAAGIAMLDVGDPAAFSTMDSDNFFDTATWGDLGGQVWVARFDQPGKRDNTTHRVTNWRAARAFEEGRTSTGDQFGTNRSEFYYMTSNALEQQRRQIRTMIGSGDREQILSQGMGCGPDNLMSCCQAGCKASVTTTVSYNNGDPTKYTGGCQSSATFACTATTGKMTYGALNQGCGTSGAAVCASNATTQAYSSTAGFTLNCGATTDTTFSGSTICDQNGLCTVNPVGTGHDLTPANAGTCANKSKFYAIWTYGGLDPNATGSDPTLHAKKFSTVATDDYSTAVTFDRNRFTDVAGYSSGADCSYTKSQNCALVNTTQAHVDSSGNLTCLDASSACSATVDDPGWYYTYNVTCPTQAACSSSCTWEKTASGSAVVNSCATWNSFLPKGAAQSGTNDPCQGAETQQQGAIAYSSNFVSGVPTLACNQGRSDATEQDTTYRGTSRTTITPPAAPMARNSITAGGKVYYSTLQLDPGTPATSSSSGSRNVAAPLYWLEVPRDAHACRHESNTNCE
ncbi:MAG TPA: hypothetical protein VFG59_09835 [Anaeromyxobacter sp.]|nr:hypothetical protein [Anaeromyxobacter sp.]